MKTLSKTLLIITSLLTVSFAFAMPPPPPSLAYVNVHNNTGQPILWGYHDSEGSSIDLNKTPPNPLNPNDQSGQYKLFVPWTASGTLTFGAGSGCDILIDGGGAEKVLRQPVTTYTCNVSRSGATTEIDINPVSK